MNIKIYYIIFGAFFSIHANRIHAQSQTWVDSLERHGRDVFMPAEKYKWDWGQATFLHALKQLHAANRGNNPEQYVSYISSAMAVSRQVANGRHPNAVASAHGVVFLARTTGDADYKKWSGNILKEYHQIPKTFNGGVSHRAETLELWDDTVYMLSMFLLEMYKMTGDEQYISYFLDQYNAHNEKLLDKKTGLWVHGWDADTVFYDDGCSVKNWPDKYTHRNNQIWARGNGWVGMALADALEAVGPSSRFSKPLASALKHFVKAIKPYQDKESGHWYQLVTLPQLEGNFLESSSTAMFAYAIIKGIHLKVLHSGEYLPMVEKAYVGLRRMSMRNPEGTSYLVPTRVSGGTCVGDQAYYLGRKLTEGTGFGYGSMIMFGLAYETYISGKK